MVKRKPPNSTITSTTVAKSWCHCGHELRFESRQN